MQKKSLGHIFVTGATGCLGSAFIPRLTEETGARITLLVRDTPSGRRSRERFCKPAHVDWVEGDVTEPNMGLSDAVLSRLRESVTEVWHMAAMTRFEESLREQTFLVNVTGTRHLLDFVESLPNLEMLHHVSTAYVSGRQNPGEVVAEGPMARPASFRNPYEESKFTAEEMVRATHVPFTIYRPSIVLSDPELGDESGLTVYGVAKMARMAKLMAERARLRGNEPEYSFRVVGDPQAQKNIIPVETVADMMLAIRDAKPAAGRTFHITNPVATRMAELRDSVVELLNLEVCDFVPRLNLEELSVAERSFQRMSGIYEAYMTESDPHFDTTNTESVLGAVVPPRVDVEYLKKRLHRFYEVTYGEEYWTLPAPRTTAVA